MDQRVGRVARIIAVGALLGSGLAVAPNPASAATITVDALGDLVDGTDGVTTLPEAIAEANATAGADVIVFDSTVFDPAGGPYAIATTSTFAITDDLTITGPGIDVLDVSSSSVDGTFLVDLVDAALTVTDLSITGSTGPGISVVGTNAPLTIERVAITLSGGDGVEAVGGTRPTDVDPTPVGDVTVVDSFLDFNGESGLDAGLIGALDIDGSSLDENGEEGLFVFESGDITIDDSTLSSNVLEGAWIVAPGTVGLSMVTASGNGSDNLFVAESGAITITDGVFDGATDDGSDGIEIVAAAPVTLTRVTANDNFDDGIEIDGLDADPDDLAGPVVGMDVTTLRNGENGVDIELVNGVDLTRVVSNDNGPATDDFGIGLGVLDAQGPVSVTSSEFRRNNGVDGGGVLISRVLGDVTLTDLDITDNIAEFDGGGMVLAFVEGSATLTRLLVDGNQVTDTDESVGAGIYAALESTTLTIVDSTISDNVSALDGGGLIIEGFDPDSSATVRRSTIAGNSAVAFDGGVATFGVPLIIENSTITGNTAGQAASALGVAFASADVSHSTITGNTATGTAATIATAEATVALDHTVVAGNTGDEYEEIVIVVPATPSVTSANHSYLGGDAAAAFVGTGNVTVDTPGLDALADNGGLTDTMRPSDGSPLLGAGDPAISGAPDTDQRGSARIVGTIDIGAVELDPGQLDLAPTSASVTEADGSVELTVTRTGTADGAVSADLASTAGTATADVDFTTVAATVSWADGETGPKTVTVIVATDDEVESDEDFTVSITTTSGAPALGDTSSTITITDSTTVPTTTTTTTTTTTVPTTSGPPRIAPVDDRRVAPGAIDVVTVRVNEPDGEPVTLTAEAADPTLVGEIMIVEITGGSDGLTVPIAVDRTFRLEYRSLGGAGITTITLTASDGSATDTESFAITVDGALLPATGSSGSTTRNGIAVGSLLVLAGLGLTALSRRRAV